MINPKLLKKLEFSGVSSVFTRLLGKGQPTQELDDLFALAKENNINPFMFFSELQPGFINAVSKKIISAIRNSDDDNYYQYLKNNGFSLFNLEQEYLSKDGQLKKENLSDYQYLYCMLKIENISDIKKVKQLYLENITNDLVNAPYSPELSHNLRLTIRNLDNNNNVYVTKITNALKYTQYEIKCIINRIIEEGKVKENFFNLSLQRIQQMSGKTVAEHFKYYADNNKISAANEKDIYNILFRYAIDNTEMSGHYSINKFEKLLALSGLSIEKFNKDIFSPRILSASSVGQSFFIPSGIRKYNESSDLKINYINENISDHSKEMYLQSFLNYSLNDHLKKVLLDMKFSGFTLSEQDLTHIIHYSKAGKKDLSYFSQVFMPEKQDYEIMINLLKTISQPEYIAKKNIMYYEVVHNFDVKSFSQQEYNDMLLTLKEIKESNGMLSPFVKKQISFLYKNELLRDNEESIQWIKENMFNPFTVYPDIVFDTQKPLYFKEELFYANDMQFDRKRNSIFFRYVYNLNSGFNQEEARFYGNMLPFFIQNEVDPYKIIKESNNSKFPHERIFDDIMNLMSVLVKEDKDVIPPKFLQWLEHCEKYTMPTMDYVDKFDTDCIRNALFRSAIDKFILDSSLKMKIPDPLVENKKVSRL